MITNEEVMAAIQPIKKLDLRFLRDMDESLKIKEVEHKQCDKILYNKILYKYKLILNTTQNLFKIVEL